MTAPTLPIERTAIQNARFAIDGAISFGRQGRMD